MLSVFHARRSAVISALFLLFALLTPSIPYQKARAATNLVVQVRRTTFKEDFSSDWHSLGVSSIISGQTTAGVTVTLSLQQGRQAPVVRTVQAGTDGSFAISMDRIIADGNAIQVEADNQIKYITVPTMTAQIDPANQIVAGTAPANVEDVSQGKPHTLEIVFSDTTFRRVTTDATGAFRADFTDNRFAPGQIANLRYVTPDGDTINKMIRAVDPFARGMAGDDWADVVLGQPDFTQITPNQVVANRLFNPSGVYVDRSTVPNRVYVYDAGNSRILGLRALGTTSTGQECTSFSDFNATCTINPTRDPDIVLGQLDFVHSACNGDSGFQDYPDVPLASARTLCGLREEQVSITEGGSGATLASDMHGNLYVPDIFNNRILRYNDPFNTDNVADYVWGQADFAGLTCNRGAAYDKPSAYSLCLAPRPSYGDVYAGVAIDAANNLWVTDTQNNRVLRFPFDPTRDAPTDTADLVLGQPDFRSAQEGNALNQMNRPASVRVGATGMVYVADSLNNRILGFTPPFSNGMQASYIRGGFARPLGLEIDPRDDSLWICDSDKKRVVHLQDNAVPDIVPSVDQRTFGGIGIDRDGNLMWNGWNMQEGLHFSKQAGNSIYTLDAVFLARPDVGGFNSIGARDLFAGLGLEVTNDQLIYADSSRLLFWNNPQNLHTYQSADGVIGESSFQLREHNGTWFGHMRADDNNHLWVVHGSPDYARLLGFQLPLKNQAEPIYTITSPLPLLGGGSFSWTGMIALSSVALQSSCDCVWLSDRDTNRVFRIRNLTSAPTVDIVLGQIDNINIDCNQGRGRDFPSQTSLCNPGALAFDNNGNLFVADHNLEDTGNLRLLEWNVQALAIIPTTAVFGIPADRVFSRNNNFTEPKCFVLSYDPICAPWEPAFDSLGHMVIGMNGYENWRFPLIYLNPLQHPLPVGILGDYFSMPTAARFDRYNTLYVADHNRNRILIYYSETSPIPAPLQLTYVPINQQ